MAREQEATIVLFKKIPKKTGRAKKKYIYFFFQIENQIKIMFLPLEGLDWLWGSGLKKKLGLGLGPGWPFKIIGNFFEFPLFSDGDSCLPRPLGAIKR